MCTRRRGQHHPVEAALGTATRAVQCMGDQPALPTPHGSSQCPLSERQTFSLQHYRKGTHTYIHAYIHTYIHTYALIYSFIHTVHAYTYIYIHTYTHTYMR